MCADGGLLPENVCLGEFVMMADPEELGCKVAVMNYGSRATTM